MNPHHVIRFVGILILFLGLSMTVPMGVSLLYGDGSTTAIFFSMFITICAGLILFLLTKNNRDTYLNHRDGIAIVSFGWIAAGFVGAIPFLLSGSIHSFTDAYFESISGFTTTGASILVNIEGIFLNFNE